MTYKKLLWFLLFVVLTNALAGCQEKSILQAKPPSEAVTPHWYPLDRPGGT